MRKKQSAKRQGSKIGKRKTAKMQNAKPIKRKRKANKAQSKRKP